jgi:hypothetical protein
VAGEGREREVRGEERGKGKREEREWREGERERRERMERECIESITVHQTIIKLPLAQIRSMHTTPFPQFVYLVATRTNEKHAYNAISSAMLPCYRGHNRLHGVRKRDMNGIESLDDTHKEEMMAQIVQWQIRVIVNSAPHTFHRITMVC